MSDAILNKVRKLLRLAESPNAHEAALAAAKAQQLIDEHKLGDALLALDDSTAAEPDEPIVNFRDKDAPLDGNGSYVDRWRGRLAVTVSDANGCKVFTQSGRLHIIGRCSDVDTTRYLYAFFATETERLCDREGRGCGTTWRNNFRHGVVDAIARKLREQHDAFAAKARAAAGDSTALMRVDRALAVVEKKRTDVERWAKQHMKLRSVWSATYSGDKSAREQGRQAGKTINYGGPRPTLGVQRGIGNGSN